MSELEDVGRFNAETALRLLAQAVDSDREQIGQIRQYAPVGDEPAPELE